MFRSVGLATLLGAARSSANILVPIDGQIILGAPGGVAPSGLYTLNHGSWASAIEFGSDFPIKSLGANDMRPMPRNPRPDDDPDLAQNMVCCPPGTVFNGESCVFLASQICPRGFILDPVTKSICISATPPCPLDLKLEDGLCVSPRPPICLDPTAVFNAETLECVSTADPVCDDPLKIIGPDCVSDKPPICLPGFFVSGARCVSTTPPTCSSVDLLVDKDSQGNPICVSKDPPTCRDGSRPSGNECVSTTPPECLEGFKPEGGSCILESGPCPNGSKFTEFTDQRAPVCRTEKGPVCDYGELQDGECVTAEAPRCDPDYTLDEATGDCVLSVPLSCDSGQKPIITQQHGKPRALCCPDFPGMTLNDENKCSVPATEQDCPEDMYPDPDNDEMCIYMPGDIDCGLGTLDPATKRCKFVSTPECTVGKPVNGKCVSNPVCKTEGAKYNPHSGACHLREPPVCPENSRLIGTQCISDDPSKCPAPSKLSLDKKRCVYDEKPKCPEKARYDADLQLCVFDNKPKCADGTGDLDGADCVSPSRPACLNPDTEFDPVTGACVGKKRPECETGFDIPPGGTRCISNKGPVCEGSDFRLVGDKCISDKEPECPPNSKWINVKKACVSDKGPCAEGTPDSNGNCVNPEPPRCGTPGTHFEPGFGCLADEKPKCHIPNTQLNEETGECEADTGPSCDEGLELRGNHCVSQKKPHCPDHTEPKDGKCVAKAKPVCDRSDLTFNEVRKACVGGDPRCPDGTALDRDMSKCITASSRTCFVMLACPDVHDDTSPPSIEG